MAISKVQLPDNSTHDINDARIASTDITQWNGKQDTLVSGENIKTVNNESLLGSGNLTITGEPGDDGVGISSVVQTTESTESGGTNVITVTMSDGTSNTINVRNGDAVGSVVVSQEIGTSTTATMSQDSITKKLQEITNYKREVENAYVYVTWEYGRLDTDGTITTGYGAVSEMLPVIPNETISLNSIAVVKVAYFDKNKSFLSIVSMSSGMNDYTVPSNAYYARYQFDSDGGPAYFTVRKRTFENKSFSDLILSPLRTNISIGFTGDSNTTGYGVTGNKSWANLMSDALTGITSMRYDVNSPWVYALGYGLYSGGANMRAGSVFGIKTDATSITLGYRGQYDAAWSWYVDGVQTGTASSTTLELDGNLHLVEVRFTAGQLFEPHFIVPKGITCTNNATFGASISNMTFVSGYDWIFIMIGTNQRTGYTFNDFKFGEYAGKGTYIVPFPNHRSESAYNISQLQAYTYEMDIFRNIGYDVLNLSDFNAAPFYDSTYYQEDGIHFNAAGHKVIANMVAGHLGLPLCLQV